MTDAAEDTETCESEERPLTYVQASSGDWNLITSRKRYEELTDRDMSARTAAKLRERGEFDPGKPGHRLVAEAQPLTAEERLELMTHGEVLARYYRHPGCWITPRRLARAGSRAAPPGAPARNKPARTTVSGPRASTTWSGQGPQRFGLTDEEYAAALARLGDPEPGSSETSSRILCAHADQDGRGSHWLEPGERCPLAVGPERDWEAGQ